MPPDTYTGERLLLPSQTLLNPHSDIPDSISVIRVFVAHLPWCTTQLCLSYDTFHGVRERTTVVHPSVKFRKLQRHRGEVVGIKSNSLMA